MPNELKKNSTQPNEPEKPHRISLISIVVTWTKKYIAIAIVFHKEAWYKLIAWFKAKYKRLEGIIKFICWFLW